MELKSKLFIFTLLFAIFTFVDAADGDDSKKIVPIDSIPNEKYGCPPINSLISCIWYNKQCDTETNRPCPGTKLCCPNECGTSCKVPTYIKPSPIKGCPPINTRVICIWFNEQCNNTDKRCPADSICCSNNCGSFCVKKNRRRRQPNPVKGCPAIDTSVVCVWYDEQCNNTDKICPANSICCSNNCGAYCVKQKKRCSCSY